MTENKPRTHEFLKFAKLLIEDAPPNYTPWFFRCAKNGKVPAVKFGSWTDPKNRLTVSQAVEWMLEGGNIGIAAMNDDPLVNIDLDGEKTKENMFKIPTLLSRSRSRKGIHGFYFSFDFIPNIPTDNDGEVRSRNQYVIAPGSYVPTDPETVPEHDRVNAGYYTVEQELPPAWITYEDLPEIFKKTYEQSKNTEVRPKTDYDPKQATGRHSALFEVTAEDIVRREGRSTNPKKRWASFFHESKTKANTSFTNMGLICCWHHNVTLNGLQALTVLSGYLSCEEAGTPHRSAGLGQSKIIGDNGAIFHSWLYAKNHGYIPQNDSIPVKGLHYIASKHLGYNAKNGELLPRTIYREVLKIVEDRY